MSMSTHIIGFRPPDDEWKKKAEAYRACATAGVPIPAELERFFNFEGPDPAGISVDLKRTVAKDWDDGDAGSGYEIHLKDLPPNVTIIRFYNSW